MARRAYDRLMIATKIGTNRKIRRLRPEQRWAHVAGVLALAAESPIPGHLLIADGVRVVASDVAEHAGVSDVTATKTLDALRELGVIKYDAEAECEYVHDWDEWNPAPKHDPTAAERMKRYRERLRNSERNDGVVTERNARNGDGSVRGGSKKREVEGTTSGTSNVPALRPPLGSSNVVEFANVDSATTGEAA